MDKYEKRSLYKVQIAFFFHYLKDKQNSLRMLN